MVYIPILFELEKYLFTNNDILDGFCIINFISAIILLFYFLRHPLKYGKFYKAGSSKHEINDRIATSIINFIPIVIYCSYYLIYDGYSLTTLPSICFICIHLYRCTVYAFKIRSRYSTPWPLKTVIFMCIYKACFAILAGHAYIIGEFTIGSNILYFLKILIVFITFALQFVSDMKLSKLRYFGERGYKVPSDKLFKYISCPNYLLEIIFWITWGTMFDLDFCVIAMWLWLLPMLFGRAENTHKWYGKFFSNSYPKNRTSIIPFLDISNVLKVIIGSMEYGW